MSCVNASYTTRSRPPPPQYPGGTRGVGGYCFGGYGGGLQGGYGGGRGGGTGRRVRGGTGGGGGCAHASVSHSGYLREGLAVHTQGGVWPPHESCYLRGVRGLGPASSEASCLSSAASRREGLAVHTQGSAYTRWCTHKAVHTQGSMWPRQGSCHLRGLGAGPYIEQSEPSVERSEPRGTGNAFPGAPAVRRAAGPVARSLGNYTRIQAEYCCIHTHIFYIPFTPPP